MAKLKQHSTMGGESLLTKQEAEAVFVKSETGAFRIFVQKDEPINAKEGDIWIKIGDNE